MEKRGREGKKLPKITKQASSLLDLMGKEKMSLENRISFLAEPSGQAEHGPACVERMPLGLPVAGIFSSQEGPLGGNSVLHRVAQGACNPVYEFDPNLL